MRRKNVAYVLAFVGASLFLPFSADPQALKDTSTRGLASRDAFVRALSSASSGTRNTATLEAAYGRLPLAFEANTGQTDSQVKFLARGPGYALFLTPGEVVMVLHPLGAGSGVPALPQRPFPRAEGETDNEKPTTKDARLGKMKDAGSKKGNPTVVRMKFSGANPEPRLRGLEEVPGKVNYFIGNDPKKWQTAIPTYARVEYRDVYPGVNLVFYGNQRELEYDFVVAPGADPGAIALAFEGADKLAIDAQGDLVLKTAGGEVRQRKPFVYQDVRGMKQPVQARYVLKGPHHVGFHVAAYDTSRSVVIDPLLSYSTYLGGQLADQAWGITVDSSGNAYVTGQTYSLDFPTTPNALQPTLNTTTDVFVTKLNPTGSALVYSTYLGGSDGETGMAIAVDPVGAVYVTGGTSSSDFPTTPGAFQRTLRGCQDAFVIKLDPSGSSLGYSTYLGGSEPECGAIRESGSAVAVDAAGHAFVTGVALSSDFPTTPGAFQRTLLGGWDGFVTKLNPTGSAVVYSTYLGGSGWDDGSGIAVDTTGHAYVTGWTYSADFPLQSPLQPTLGGYWDAFVTKLNPTGSALVYSTYLGGNSGDQGEAVALDAVGNAYVAGVTSSTDFPLVNPLQPLYGGGGFDAFVAKLNPTGSALVYSTYLGGSDYDIPRAGIAIDAEGKAYVAGSTWSADFPTVNPLQPPGASTDAFVAVLSSTGSALLFSTHLGGSGPEDGYGFALDSSGNAYVAGRTNSRDFPITPGAFQPVHGSRPDCFFFDCDDAFVTKFHLASTQGLTLGLNQQTFRPPEQLILDAIVSPGSTPVTVDAYVALRLPDETLLFLQGDGSFTSEIRPIVTSWPISPFWGRIFAHTFAGWEPGGSYTWLAAFTEPGTLNIVGPIAQAPFSFSP